MLFAIAALICPSVMGSMGFCGPAPMFPMGGASMSMKGLLSFSNLLDGNQKYEKDRKWNYDELQL
jgi:hypothetical protein